MSDHASSSGVGRVADPREAAGLGRSHSFDLTVADIGSCEACGELRRHEDFLLDIEGVPLCDECMASCPHAEECRCPECRR